MRRIFSIMIFVFLALPGVRPLDAQWEATSGPNAGFVNCFAVRGTRLFAGTLNGVYLSTDNGASWTPVDSGLPTTYDNINCLAWDDTNLYAGTWHGLYVSTDNGMSWAVVDSALTGISVTSLAMVGTNLFAGTLGSGVFISTNDGTDWAPVDSGLTDGGIFSLAVLPGGTGDTSLFAGTSGGGIFLSTDNGGSWTAANSGLTDTWVRSFAAVGRNLFAGTESGVCLSTNDGASWTAAGLTGADIFSFYALPNGASGTNLFAGARYYDTVIVVPVDVSLPSAHRPNPFAGTGTGGLYLSTDNGTSWSPADSGLKSTNVWALAALGPDLFAGTAEGTVWRRPLSEMVTAVQKRRKILPGAFLLEQNYPNPFNPSTVISYQLPGNSLVVLNIFDALGREVETLVNKRQTAGSHSVTFDAADLPSGVYFYRLEAGPYHDTKKLLLLK